MYGCNYSYADFIGIVITCHDDCGGEMIFHAGMRGPHSHTIYRESNLVTELKFIRVLIL